MRPMRSTLRKAAESSIRDARIDLATVPTSDVCVEDGKRMRPSVQNGPTNTCRRASWLEPRGGRNFVLSGGNLARHSEQTCELIHC